MSGRIVHGRELSGLERRSADVVVCGGGAGGCMAARELARAGLSVVLVEEGGDHTPPDFDQREENMLPLLFQDMAGRRTEDMAIPILSGRGLGGSTIHNQNLCKRIPDALLDHWSDDLGVEGVSPADLAPLYEEVERDLGVRRIADHRVNRHNQLIQQGAEALGFAGGRLHHNRDERCIGSGFCELGCAYDGKLNARRVLVPQMVSAGAIVYTDARVERVLHDGRKATGVEATLLDAERNRRGTLRIQARAVCLAGSALGSPTIALRSDIPDPHGVIGASLRLHPGAVVAGVFDESVEAWKGVPQSYECTELLDPSPGSERRVWLVPSFAHPVGTASLLPTFGPDLHREMRRYANLGVLAAMVHDETRGRVYLDGDHMRIAYEPIESDREQLALGIREGARVLLAAGAKECIVPAIPSIVIRTEGDLDAVDADRFLPHDARLTAVHPMGSLCMGSDPERSATDSRGAFHQLDGLWVVDGSLFPTSIGVPPQINIYTFGMRVAREIARDVR